MGRALDEDKGDDDDEASEHDAKEKIIKLPLDQSSVLAISSITSSSFISSWVIARGLLEW
jgi:hypothetical protein